MAKEGSNFTKVKDLGGKALEKLKKRGLVKKTEGEDTGPDKFRAAVLFVFMIFFLLLVFVEGSSGWQFLHRVIRGFFGVSSLLVPILIGMAAWKADSDNNDAIQATAKWNIIITIIISGSIQVLFTGDINKSNVIEYIKYLYEDGIENTFGSGGVVSAILSYPLLTFMGTTGARIVVVLMLLVLMFWISKKSPRDLIYMMTHPFSSTEDEEESADENDEFSVPMDYVNGDEKVNYSRSFDVFDDFDDEPKVKKPFGQKVKHFFFGGDFQEYADDTGAYSQKLDGYKDVPSAPTEEIPYEEPQPEEEEKYIQDPQAIYGYGEITYPEENAVPVQEEQYYEPEPTIVDTGSAVPANTPNSPYGLPLPEEEENKKKQSSKSNLRYMLPDLSLLKKGSPAVDPAKIETELSAKQEVLKKTFSDFHVDVIIDENGKSRGPSVTRYEVQPAAGVKVSKITGLADDIALALAADGIRIEAPIPGKSAIGIEVPNSTRDTVALRDILESPAFRRSKSKLVFALGKDIAGNAVVGDIAKMPHMIIAGTTGSGKSVCTNSIIMSILMNATPEEVKLILIDPKVVEFRVYEGIPHLLIPVVTDPKKAAGALNWAVQEMQRRYELFADNNVRDIQGYNSKADLMDMDRMPQIVIAIDELADLMMTASKEVEDLICRLAQKARAAGMHLIIATQRPTTDIITGLIKANVPSRIALSVKSQIDSRTILDVSGAEKLLGHGDMLYVPNGMPKPIRVQGCFTSTEEIESVVNFIKGQCDHTYDPDIMQEVEQSIPVTKSKSDKTSYSSDGGSKNNDAELIDAAIEFIVESGQASTSSLQRYLKIGFQRAGRIMDELESMGIIGPPEGSKPRKVLITPEQYLESKSQE